MRLPHVDVTAAVRPRTLGELWQSVRQRVWEHRRVALLEYEVVGALPARPARLPVHFRWAAPADLEALKRPDLNFTDRTVQEARRWLAGGDRCLIGYVDGEPATYWWVTFSVRRLPGRRLRVGRRQAYVYKSFTLERLRGHGLSQAALCVVLEACRAVGIRRVFADVALKNVASLRSLGHVGFRQVGTFSIVRVGRWRYACMGRALRRRVSSDVESRASS